MQAASILKVCCLMEAGRSLEARALLNRIAKLFLGQRVASLTLASDNGHWEGDFLATCYQLQTVECHLRCVQRGVAMLDQDKRETRYHRLSQMPCSEGRT